MLKIKFKQKSIFQYGSMSIEGSLVNQVGIPSVTFHILKQTSLIAYR